MAYLQRKLRQKIYEEERKIVNSLILEAAHSQDKGIHPTEIYGYNNTFLRGIIDSFMKQRIIKTDGRVCWLDYSKFEEYLNRRKSTNVVIIVFIIVVVIVTMAITWILR